MNGRTLLTVVSTVVFAAVWLGIGLFMQATASAEAAQQEAEAAQRARENIRFMAAGITAYAAACQDESERGHPDSTAQAGALDDLKFIVGTWRGEKDGGLVEEVWSRPHGNAMMGMFRWLNAEGRSRMYELLTISREDDETFLRLRHFTPKMIAWEEKDTPVELKLSESSDLRVVFVNVSESDRMERIVFHQPEAGKLTIDVEFREAADRAPLRFQLSAAE